MREITSENAYKVVNKFAGFALIYLGYTCHMRGELEADLVLHHLWNHVLLV